MNAQNASASHDKRFLLEVVDQTDTVTELRLFEDEITRSILQRTLDKAKVDALIKGVEEGYKRYSTDTDLAALGRQLLDFIDGDERWIAKMRDKAPAGFTLAITCQDGLRHLPWELMHDGTRWLCACPDAPIVPVRHVHNGRSTVERENRSLRLLFMACSAEGVEPELDFEGEEALILTATQEQPVELVVEETGSLEGLEFRMTGYDPGHFDVFHLSGHADVIDDTPVFIMEDPLGQRCDATAEDIKRAIHNRWPRLVFLSGCRTGQAPDLGSLASLGESLVSKGAPCVVGWALPVGDLSASMAAAMLYVELEKGESIASAVAWTRNELRERGVRDWHLLRIFSDASPLDEVVTPRETKDRIFFRYKQAAEEFLDPGTRETKICSREEYVGRRRMLQRCLRALTVPPGVEGHAVAVCLHGLGGNGKSTLAARLCERLQAYHRVVCTGRIDEDLFQRTLNRVAGRILKEDSQIAELNSLLANEEIPLETRLERAFIKILANDKLIFVFDDFEHSLERNDDGTPILDGNGFARIQPGPAALLSALPTALHAAGSPARLIVTCRYKIAPPAGLPWYGEQVDMLKGTAWVKKQRRLRHDDIDPELWDEAIAIADGNPRLIEMLHAGLRTAGLEHEALLEKLRQTELEFREKTLLLEMLESLDDEERFWMRHAALFEIPVECPVWEAAAGRPVDEQALTRPVSLGLLETAKLPEETCIGFLPAIVREPVLEWWDEAEQADALQRATAHLYETWWKGEGGIAEIQALELIRLACETKNLKMAAELGDAVMTKWLHSHRYREMLHLAQRITEVGEEAQVLYCMALAESTLGLTGNADQLYRRALAICPKDEPTLRAELLGQLATQEAQRGAIDQALEHLEEAEQVFRSEGDVRSRAVAMGKIADILEARGDLDEALRIRNEEQLPVFEKLGDVRARAVTMGKIADILEARGDLDEALRIRTEEQLPVYDKLGDVRSRAVTMGHIADILFARGDLDEALRIRKEEELPVFEKLGDVRSRAVTMGQIADILSARGELDEALRIRTEEVLPSFQRLGDPRLCAVEKGKIADILYARGDLDEALQTLREECLPAFDKLGDVRSLLVARTNTALILRKRNGPGDREEAQRLLKLALDVARQLGIPEAARIESILEASD